MENAKGFDFEKLVDYLHIKLPYMAPAGRPRGLIESWQGKPTPYQANLIKQRQKRNKSQLPEIGRKSCPHWTDLKNSLSHNLHRQSPKSSIASLTLNLRKAPTSMPVPEEDEDDGEDFRLTHLNIDALPKAQTSEEQPLSNE